MPLVARAYMRLFVEAVWKPFEAAGRPEERWPEISEALERLRPLAELPVGAFVVGHGEPVTEDVHEALARELGA